jgi:hypothetical protein
MSGNTANESPNVIGAQASGPTGYRVSIVPGALEVSARLASAEEIRSLAKVLQASIAIWADSESEAPLTLSKRLAKAG